MYSLCCSILANHSRDLHYLTAIACFVLQLVKLLLVPGGTYAEYCLFVTLILTGFYALKKARGAESAQSWRLWHCLWHLIGSTTMAYGIYVEWAIYHQRPRFLVD